MPRPTDITDALYQSRKLRRRRSVKVQSETQVRNPTTQVQMRRLTFSSFSFAVGLTLIIVLCGQLLIMSLFNWL